VIDVRLEADIEQAMESHVTVMATEAAAIHRTTLANHASDYSDVMREFVERGSEILGADYLDAQRLRLRFSRAVDALFDRCDVVLTPSTPTPAPRNLETTGDPSFQTPWTFAGVPAISIPSGLSEDGLPFGIQLIGPRFVEGALLQAAAWCEQVLDVKLEPDLARFVS
jgi:aspartyl-tRNA(Asn)/glutamyl-tRNA(Gln) amidotransferase subunit A